MGRLKNGSLHRFGDKVAISLPGKGETLYLSADEAKLLAQGLSQCADNIAEQPKFSQSNFGTFEVPLANEGKR